MRPATAPCAEVGAAATAGAELGVLVGAAEAAGTEGTIVGDAGTSVSGAGIPEAVGIELAVASESTGLGVESAVVGEGSAATPVETGDAIGARGSSPAVGVAAANGRAHAATRADSPTVKPPRIWRREQADRIMRSALLIAQYTPR
jgi:hypothetical protein